MTEYDNMAGSVRQGFGRVTYMVGTDMTPYDNMTRLIPRSHLRPISTRAHLYNYLKLNDIIDKKSRVCYNKNRSETRKLFKIKNLAICKPAQSTTRP
jgi:hypothetical protein